MNSFKSKSTFLLMIALLFSITSCDKNNDLEVLNNEENFVLDYSKELILKDASGLNTVTVNISTSNASFFEVITKDFLVIEPLFETVESDIQYEGADNSEEEDDITDVPVHIDIISTKLQEGVIGFSLTDIPPQSNLKRGWSYYTVTNNQFACGLIKKTNGRGYTKARIRTRTSHWSWWTTLSSTNLTGNGQSISQCPGNYYKFRLKKKDKKRSCSSYYFYNPS